MSNHPAGANPLDDVHTDEEDQHQRNGQLSEVIELHSDIHLHLRQQPDVKWRPVSAPVAPGKTRINVPAQERIKI